MGDSRRQYVFLFFLFPALVLTAVFIRTPSELEWNLVVFLLCMAVFDQVNLKVFSGFGYSFVNVMVSLIIFDQFSIIYGMIYLLLNGIVAVILQKKANMRSMISLYSIYMIIIIACNQLYNEYLEKAYSDRYLTLLLMLVLSILLKYAYVYLETGAITSKLFLDRFGPMMFEIAITFPILAFFEQLEVNLVLMLFLSYYTIIGFLHKKFMAINQDHINLFTEKITRKYAIDIYFMDLKEIKGIINLEKKVIFIDEKLDYPEQLQTMIHELLHYHISGRFYFPKKAEESLIILFEALVSWYYIIIIRFDQK
ncbi:hypothetical protein [Bacillus sp. MRMR6]|uniref:hypothetical protein n=1 Tax=Bacillus sp. MRMR6 TaxID=1928617 RepID=UPI0009512D6E|nr:hypothetical protein [Bacillus sp. MRMR6]OLS41322.1 hypothetical protein BTR25_05550 [Bacillus sp. MRMR6]